MTGTDAAGPTTRLTKALCHLNDRGQITTRAKDLRRLRTAGFVTEFGAVDLGTATGRAEVNFVTRGLDAASPPLSWVYWAFVPETSLQRRALARAYPRAVDGDIQRFSFDEANGRFELEYTPRLRGAQRNLPTEIVLSRSLVYPSGFHATTEPNGCCAVLEVPYGVNVEVVDPTVLSFSEPTVQVTVMKADVS